MEQGGDDEPGRRQEQELGIDAHQMDVEVERVEAEASGEEGQAEIEQHVAQQRAAQGRLDDRREPPAEGEHAEWERRSSRIGLWPR